MSTFVVKKHLSFAFLGEGWENAYADFTPFTFADNDKILQIRRLSLDQVNMKDEDVKKASQQIMDIIADKFIEGKGFNGKELIEITKENLKDLPMELTVFILNTIQGQGVLPKND